MSRIPLFGTTQRDGRAGGIARLRTRSLHCWRAADGVLGPLNPAMSVAYRGRTAPAAVYATNGASLSLVASLPAFSAVDWNRDGVRESDVLELGSEEALRFYDASSGGVVWTTGPKVVRLEWIERGAALIANAPYWSLTNDAITGAYLAVLGDGSGNVKVCHYNGTSTVSSALPVAPDDCCVLVAHYLTTGAVRVSLSINGAPVVTGTTSAALAPAGTWGGGSGVQVRLNERGNAVRGVVAMRYAATFGGEATRQTIVETL